MSARSSDEGFADHLAAIHGLSIIRDPESRAAAGRDFGGLTRGDVQAIARPADPDALARLVDAARRGGFRLTARSGGLSQSGQSLPRRGVSVDMTGFTDVAVDAQAGTARCGSGATWRQLLAATTVHGLAPLVTPLNLDLTIGGTLSAGGAGSTSHAHGFAISSVASFEAVTGAAERVVAGPSVRTDVYDAVLGGAGRFGFICNAEIRLRPALPLTRTYYLLYDDLAALLSDEQAVMSQPWCTHLEGFASAAIQGIRRGAGGRRGPFARWFFGMHISTEYAEGAPPDDDACLRGLHFRERLHVEDNPSAEYAARYDVRFAMMRATGAWTQVHPWFECTIPVGVAPTLLPEVIEAIPLLLGDGHRIMPIADVPRPGLFMAASPGVALGVMPPGVPQAFEAPAMAGLRAVHERMVGAGGKRYLSGWLFEPDDAAWRRHFGDRYDAWQRSKQQLDPDGVLESVLFTAPPQA